MIIIPAQITTDRDKMAFGLRVSEKLRVYHNAKGATVDKGNPIELAIFRDWQSKVFQPLQQEALLIANDAKQAMYKAETWDSQIDIDALITAKESDIAK